MIVVAAFERQLSLPVSTMSQWWVRAVEKRGGHLGVAEHAGPFAEGEIGGDDDGRSLVEPADEMEQQLAAGLGERQVAEFVEDDEVHPGQMLGDTTLPSVAGLDLQAVDEVAGGRNPKSYPALIETFGRAMRKNLTTGSTPFRKPIFAR